MKIEDLTYSRPIGPTQNRAEEAGPGDKQGRAKDLTQGDLVRISTSLEGVSTLPREEEQARRVAALKARIEEGSYRVDPRLVAERMLSASAGI